jgi:hypothetical protein
VNGLEKDFGSRIDFQTVNIHNSRNAALMEQYGFTAAPELYLVDQDGSVLGAWDGSVTGDELRQAFERALKKQE